MQVIKKVQPVSFNQNIFIFINYLSIVANYIPVDWLID